MIKHGVFAGIAFSQEWIIGLARVNLRLTAPLMLMMPLRATIQTTSGHITEHGFVAITFGQTAEVGRANRQLLKGALRCIIKAINRAAAEAIGGIVVSRSSTDAAQGDLVWANVACKRRIRGDTDNW